MQKSLDQKLEAIHRDPSGAKEFIIADAKDADMAFGLGAPGQSPEMHAGEVRFRTLAEYREQIEQIVRQGVVDIMLMSVSTADLLVHRRRLFDNSHVTPAIRANDASDVFVVRGGRYVEQPSRPFRSASLDHAQCGHLDCDADERRRGVDLGLYSITFNNRLDEDLASLEAYRSFRIEAERKGFRHFLEVFDPNAPRDLDPDKIPAFVNDHIARTLAGVAQAGRPLFLKVVYHGPKAMEELVSYDPHLIVGVLGGSAGTTYDAFKLIHEAQKYGARVALFGRKINNAENQLAFIQFLRLITDGVISPEEAVRAYHAVLAKLGLRPKRSLEDDLQLQTNVMSYCASRSTVRMDKNSTPPAGRSADSEPASAPVTIPAGPDGQAHLPDRARRCGCQTTGRTASPPANNAQASSPQAAHVVAGEGCRCQTSGKQANGALAASQTPDFSRMTQAEKLAYNQALRDRIFGR